MPISTGKPLSGDDLTLNEIGIHNFFILKIRKIANGHHIDLDNSKLTRLV